MNKEIHLGMGWRHELAWFIENRNDIEFVEVLAEDVWDLGCAPSSHLKFPSEKTRIFLHGTSLSLGGAEPVPDDRLKRFARIATQLDCSLISEHIAFVRADGIETGHLLPVPRTKTMLDIICDNIKRAQEIFPCPIALENIANLFEFPDNEMSEPEFIWRILDKTNTQLLLDVANLYANSFNHGYSATRYLDALPLERVAYVHVAGGAFVNEFYHDTHCHNIHGKVLDLLQEVSSRIKPLHIMLERDGSFPSAERMHAELNAILRACSSVPVKAGGIGTCG